MPTATIAYHPDRDPVTIEVTSGHATLGNFRLLIRRIAGGAFEEFGSDPKRLGDDIRDLFVIPVPPDQLADHVLLIPAKYMPGPGQNRIDVTYEFVQEGEVLDTPIRIAEPTTEPFRRYHHRVFFQPVAAAAPDPSA